MPADDFWYGDSWLAAAYREAHDLNRQRKSEEMWLQGLYFYNALETVATNLTKKKGHRPSHYMEEPIRITPLTEEEKKIKAEKERQKLIAYFNNLAKQAGGEVLTDG